MTGHPGDITEYECCAKAALCDDWEKTAARYRIALEEIAAGCANPMFVARRAIGQTVAEE